MSQHKECKKINIALRPDITFINSYSHNRSFIINDRRVWLIVEKIAFGNVI